MREKTSNICMYLTPKEICQILAVNKIPETIPREEREKRRAACQLLAKIKNIVFIQPDKKDKLLETFAKSRIFTEKLVDAIVYNENKTVNIIITENKRPRYNVSMTEKGTMISVIIPNLEDW